MKNTKDISRHQIENPKSQAQSSLRKRLLTVKEAGEYLGRSESAVRELQWAGRLPFVQEGKRIFFDRLDLDLWIEEHKRKEPALLE